ncbi:MAG: sulfatase, partial [Planctomycetota bacterium]|nr:sulfatase [Planctomycetota bacterium]
DSDAAVRYWAFTGIGNAADTMTDAEKSEAHDLGLIGLKDESRTVQVAAGRALCLLGKPESALQSLAGVLRDGEQWERLHAAIVLDEIDEMARPLIAEMHRALTPRAELYARGKYTVRVINRALNQLENTTRTVP